MSFRHHYDSCNTVFTVQPVMFKVGLPDLPYFTGDPVFQTLSPASRGGEAAGKNKSPAGSIKRSSARPSVCPSVSLSHQSNAAAACGAGLLLSNVRAKDIDRQRRAPGSSSAAARGHSTALSSKCGQRHVDSRINEAKHRLGLLSTLGLLTF